MPQELGLCIDSQKNYLPRGIASARFFVHLKVNLCLEMSDIGSVDTLCFSFTSMCPDLQVDIISGLKTHW